MIKLLLRLHEKYQSLNLKITLALISLQILHLYWLTIYVLIPGNIEIASQLLPLFIIIDYIEIPALLSGIVFYLFIIKQSNKNILYLILLLIQFIHIFWLTDEIVYKTFIGNSFVVFPPLAALIAILIDYLEIPIIIDLFRRLYISPKL